MTDSELEEAAILSDALQEFKENVTKSVLAMVDEVKDIETQDILLQSISEMTKGGEEFADSTKLQVVSKVTSIVKDQIGEVSKRKRRSIDEGGSLDDGKTPEEVNNFLSSCYSP